MKITIFGTGYVGLVTGACLAEVGHQVLCMDIDSQKIAQLKQGIVPIYESGLENLIIENAKNGQLCFSANLEEAVEFSNVQFIAVGTPADGDGSADLKYVLTVAANIGRLMTNSKTIVTKSTVPVGTADKVYGTNFVRYVRVHELLPACQVVILPTVILMPCGLRQPADCLVTLQSNR